VPPHFLETNYEYLLIEIFAPLAGGRGQGRIGTGIPIAKNRILTAAHCLLDESLDLDADFEIRCYRWRASGKTSGQWT
jgi:V8-like Glu-specific endopeptidase